MSFSPHVVGTGTTQVGGIVHLRRGGTSVVVDLDAVSGPVILHWGVDLGESDAETLRSLAVAARPQRVSGGLDVTTPLGLIPTADAGWPGTPALEGGRAAGGSGTVLSLRSSRSGDDALVVDLADDQTAISVRAELTLSVGGVFSQRLTLRNDGTDDYTVAGLQPTFPLPWDATEILDTTGRHLRERSAQRHPFTFGTHLRESRRGRPGADATVLLAAGRPGFGFEAGRVHGIHVAWSGNQRVLAERVNTGEAFLMGGELYGQGEIVLAPGSEIVTPWVKGSWGDGLDELAARFHDEWRARSQHPSRPRPVMLNTWEAVYFAHSLDKLTALADAAAEIGVERFVLDDGWFRHRRNDDAGLGDWYVDEDVWPQGLHPLVDHVTALGLEFGLWVEPEMINLDSDLARAHPEWILRSREELPVPGRQQQVLNLAHPDAYTYLAERLAALLDEYPIAYLKWDHNRDLVGAGTGAGSA